MAIEHKDLTGAQLHEPKGIESANAGTVYVADGIGSGDWEDPLDGIHNLNKYAIDKVMTDMATASSLYFHVPFNSKLNEMNVIPYGVIDANTVLQIYINGVLYSDSLTLVASGSGAGIKQQLFTTTANVIPAGSIVQVVSNGAATAAVRGDIQLVFEAIE